jgi:hypothetical protein
VLLQLYQHLPPGRVSQRREETVKRGGLIFIHVDEYSLFPSRRSSSFSVTLKILLRFRIQSGATCYAGEVAITSYHLLDLTALGRQEVWEAPKGRVDHPYPPASRPSASWKNDHIGLCQMRERVKRG